MSRKQIEAVAHGQVPPQLRALAEDHADARHVPLAVREGIAAVDLHAPAVGPQDAREDLDGGRLARAVRPDEAEQFAALQLEGHADSACTVRCRRCSRPRSAPITPGSRSEIR
jgi:hypothetical protein